MARDITVTFDDGTTHVYQSAPDTITFDQALARAQKDFSGKGIANIDGGRKPTAPAPAPTEERPSLGMPMGDDFSSAIMAAAQGKPKSVLQRQQTVGPAGFANILRAGVEPKQEPLPPPLPSAEWGAVRREFIQKLESRLNAMPEAQREAELARLVQRKDVYGRAARDIQGRYEQLNKVESPALRYATDPRLEAQIERHMARGANLDTAKMLATQDALSGVIGADVAQARGLTPEEAEAQKYQFEKGMTGAEQIARTLKRVPERLQMSLAQQGAGLVTFAGDMLGFDVSNVKVTAKDIDTYMRSMGENPNAILAPLEGAAVSIATQLPVMLTGNQPVILGNMFLQSFGQSYNDARQAGLDTAGSTIKAALDGALEVISEKFGLEQTLAGLKATAKGDLNAAIKHYARGLAREIPGEEFAYVGQTATGQGFGTDPALSIEQFLRGAVDTALTTVAQTGMMMAGSAGVAKGVRKLDERALGKELQRKDYEQSAIDEYARRALSPEFYSPEKAIPGVRMVRGVAETQGPMPERPEGFVPPAAQAEPPPPAPPAPPPTPPAPPPSAAEEPKTDIYGRVEPGMGAPVTPPVEEEDRAAVINRLIAAGIDPGDASEMVEKAAIERMNAEAAAEKLRTRIDELTDEYIAAGVPPKQARVRATQQAQEEELADEDAAKAAEGEPSAARPVGKPSGAGVGVAGEPSAGAPTKRARKPKPTGVVSAGPDVTEPAAGEGREPTAVEQFGEVGDVGRGAGAANEPSGVTSIVKRRQDQIDLEEEAEDEADYAQSRIDGLKRIESTYGPQIRSIWPQIQQAKTVLKSSQFPNSLEVQAGNRIVKRLEDLVREYNALSEAPDLTSSERMFKQGVETLSQELNTLNEILDGVKNETPLKKGRRKVAAPAPAPARTSDDLYNEIKGLTEQQQALLRKDGRVPFPNSPARKKYDALGEQIAALKDQFAEADKAERAAKKAAAPAQPPAPAEKTDKELLSEATDEQLERAMQVREITENPVSALRPDDIQAEIDRRKASAATGKPRGRPKKERTAEDEQKAKELRRQQTLESNQARRDATAAINMLTRALAPIPSRAKNKDVLQEQARRDRAEAIRKLYELSRTNKNKPGKDAAEALKNPKITAEEVAQAKADYEAKKQRTAPPPRMVMPLKKPEKRVVVKRLPSLKRTLAKLRELLGAGKITPAEFADKAGDAMDTIAKLARHKLIKKRTRGADYLIERLARAKRHKELPPEAVDLAIWFITQNPVIATDLGISIREPGKEDFGVGGEYNDISKIAKLFKQNADSLTAVHEILHHIEQFLPEDARNAILQSWARALAKAAKNAKTVEEQDFLNKLLDYHFGAGVTDARALYKELIDKIIKGKVPHELYQYMDPSEFWAVNASDILKGRFDAKGDTLSKLKNWMSEFIEKVKDFFGFGSDAPVIRGLEAALGLEAAPKGRELLRYETPGMPMPKQITPADKRTAAQIEKEVNTAIENFEASATATDVADNTSLLQSLRDFDKLSAYFKGLYEKLDGARLSSVLFFMTNDTVAQWGSAYVPELANTNKLLRKMRTLGRSLLGGAEQLSAELTRAIAQDPSLRRKLEEITSVATDVRVDPAKNTVNAKLNTMYKGLGARGQQLYGKLRDYYVDIIDYYEKILDDQITQSGLPNKARDIVMAEIKKMYETDKKIVPFFPFIRNRGDLWLRVGKGKNRQFITFANEMERRAVMEKIAKEHIDSVTGKPYTVEELLGPQVGLLEKGDTLEGFRKATSDLTISLKKIFQTIDESIDPQEIVGRVAELTNVIAQENPGMSESQVREEAYNRARDEATNDVKNAIYELYLMTLPDQNFRTSFIARKDVAGYNVDLLRNFSTYAIRISSQIPRIKYGPLLRNSLRAGEKSLQGNPDASKLIRFVNEMERRVDLELNPYATPSRGVPPNLSKAIGKTVDFATRWAFVHYLSAGASALVQSTGMVYGIATLGARHGYGRAFVELGKLTKFWNKYGISRENDDGSITYHVPSIVHSSDVQASPQLRLAMREMLGAGIGEYTLTSEMLNRGRVSTAAFESRGSRLGRGAMMFLAGPFQTVERLVQESLFFMSYNLSREDGIKKKLQGRELNEYAADQAIADVYDSVGNMAETNRPPIFRNAAGRFLLQFMLYPLFITTRWAREAYRSVTAQGGAAKYQAFKEFSGIMGVTFMLAGASGLPFFSTVLGYIAAFLEDEDKKMGRQTFKDLDYWTWWRTVWLPQYMGEVGVFGRPLTEVVGMTKDQLAALFERGPTNMITGVDIASRTSINPTDMFSGQNKEVRTTKEGALQFAEDRAGPFVGMVLSYMDAYDAFADGDMQRGMEKMLPAFAKNPAVAWKYYNEGIKDFRGATILKKDSMTTGRLIYQAIGLRLDEVSNQQKFLFAVSKVENKIRFEREDILKNLRDSYGKKDFGRYNDWLKKRLEFSRKYPSYAIDDDDIVRSVTSSAERAGSAIRGFVPTEQNIPIFREAVVGRSKAMREFEERTKK